MQVRHLPNRDRRDGSVTTLKCASAHVPRFLTGSDPPISHRQLPFGCSIAQAVTTAHRRAATRNSFLIHGVQHIIDQPTRLARWAVEDRQSHVVIIGRDLPREAVLDSLKVLKARPMVHALPA